MSCVKVMSRPALRVGVALRLVRESESRDDLCASQSPKRAG